MAGPDARSRPGESGAGGRYLKPVAGSRAGRLDPRALDRAAERTLSRRLDFRALLKLRGRAEGESRCARAHEELLAMELPTDVVAEIEAWWRALEPRPTTGIVVRVLAEWDAGLPTEQRRELQRECVEDDCRAVVAAVRRGWAWSVTTEAVERCAAWGARDLEIPLWLGPAEEAVRPSEPDDVEPTVELVGGSVEGGPLGALSHAAVHRAIERAAPVALREVGARIEAPGRVVWSAGGRSVVGIDRVLACAKDLPFVERQDLAAVLGTLVESDPEARSGEGRATTRPVRRAFRAATLIAREGRILRDIDAIDRQLLREVRTLSELDVTLLPTDGVATTLATVQDLLDRTLAASGRIMASQLVLTVGLRTLLRRAVPEASLASAMLLGSGSDGPLGVSLMVSLARVVDEAREDAAARQAIEHGAARLQDLPDGPTRAALSQFLAGYGDLTRGAFDLERPRWREDPREVFEAVAEWLGHDEPARAAIERARERVRARADGERARFEPSFGWAERQAMGLLIERTQATVRARASLDRLVLRVLSLYRRVLLDADRRMRRVDPACRSGGAFACSFEGLVAGLRTGRPELGAVIAMHDVERQGHAHEARCTSGSPVRDGAERTEPMVRGIGASAGVADGRLRDVAARHGADERERVIAVPLLELAAVPRAFLAGAVLAECGGLFLAATEALRELGVPVVIGGPGATAIVPPGSLVRVDGERGSVQGLADAGVA